MDARDWHLLRIALVISGLVILFLSGLLPVEDYLSEVPPADLTAAVVPAEVAELTNRSREQNGLPPLAVSALLTQAAQLKAEDMAAKSYYAHVGPDGKSMLSWLDQVGYRYLNAGENLVIDRDTSEEAVDAWLRSASHRENILRPQFTEIGVGVAKGRYEGQDTIYVVEEFGTPYPLSVTTPKKRALPVKAALAPTASSSAIMPTLTVTPVPRTAIATDVNVLTAPVVHAIAPATGKRSATTSLPAPSATSTVASTSFAYALAPAFFAPVSYARGEASGSPAEPAAAIARPPLLDSLRQAVRHLASYVPWLLN